MVGATDGHGTQILGHSDGEESAALDGAIAAAH